MPRDKKPRNVPRGTIEPPTPAFPGAPEAYDRQKAKQVLARIADGEMLKAVCRELGLSYWAFRSWIIDDVDGLAQSYARARELRMMGMEEEILAIADDSQGDTTTRTDGRGEEYEVPDHEWIARSKLRVDTRRWIMAKVSPDKYGDRTEAKVSVGGTDKPIVIKIDPFRNHREIMAERVDEPAGATNDMANGDLPP